MARKTEIVTITDPGRDHGKTFLLTEMPADQAERYCTRALLLIMQAKRDIPADALSLGGSAGLAAVGIDDGLATLTALQDPTLDDVWQCVQYVHKPGAKPQAIMAGAGSQIEEMKTRADLRAAVLRLHLGFSEPVVPPTTG